MPLEQTSTPVCHFGEPGSRGRKFARLQSPTGAPPNAVRYWRLVDYIQPNVRPIRRKQMFLAAMTALCAGRLLADTITTTTP
jgi:hypothetical protein